MQSSALICLMLNVFAASPIHNNSFSGYSSTKQEGMKSNKHPVAEFECQMLPTAHRLDGTVSACTFPKIQYFELQVTRPAAAAAAAAVAAAVDAVSLAGATAVAGHPRSSVL